MRGTQNKKYFLCPCLARNVMSIEIPYILLRKLTTPPYDTQAWPVKRKICLINVVRTVICNEYYIYVKTCYDKCEALQIYARPRYNPSPHCKKLVYADKNNRDRNNFTCHKEFAN